MRTWPLRDRGVHTAGAGRSMRAGAERGGREDRRRAARPVGPRFVTHRSGASAHHGRSRIGRRSADRGLCCRRRAPRSRMSPELALLTIVALLWGPTAIWLLLQLVRGRRETFRRETRAGTELDSAGPRPGTEEVQALVAQYGFWVCGVCKSLNRRDAGRCYGCRTAQDEAMREPGLAPSTDMVPVMADAIAQRDPAWLEATPAMLAHPEVEAAEGEAVARADDRAPAVTLSRAGQARTPAVLATVARLGAADPGQATGNAARVTEHSRLSPDEPERGFTRADGIRRAPDRSMSGRRGNIAGPRRAAERPLPVSPPLPQHPTIAAPPPAGVPVAAGASGPAGAEWASAGGPRAGLSICPFLGMEEDPSTWYDFADPRNLCHAVPSGGSTPLGFLRRRLTGRSGAGRNQVITAAQQRTRCLTAAHRDCARYMVAMSVVGPAVEEAAPQGDVARTRMAHPSGEPAPDAPWRTAAAHEPAPVSDPAAAPSRAVTPRTVRRTAGPAAATSGRVRSGLQTAKVSATHDDQATATHDDHASAASATTPPAPAPAGNDDHAIAASATTPPAPAEPLRRTAVAPAARPDTVPAARGRAADPAPSTRPPARPAAPVRREPSLPAAGASGTPGPAGRTRAARPKSTGTASQARPTPANLDPSQGSGATTPAAGRTPTPAKQDARPKSSGRKRKGEAEATHDRNKPAGKGGKQSAQSERSRSRRTAA